MRLSEKQKEVILDSVRKIDSAANVYVFGSRADDTRKGGDIDILIISGLIGRAEKRQIRREFYDVFGEQRFDIVTDNGDYTDPFVKKIAKEAVMI